jgi:hypothetical protein
MEAARDNKIDITVPPPCRHWANQVDYTLRLVGLRLRI